MAEKRFAEACPKYDESYRLDPQLGALLHLADCLERGAQLAAAYTHFREAAEVADQRADQRASLARERAAALESRVSRLTVQVPNAARVPGLKVARDGLLLTDSSFGVAIPVDGGEHVVEATAPGYEPWRKVVRVAPENGRESIEVSTLVAVGGPAPAAAPPPSQAATAPPPGPSDRGSGGTQRTIGWVAGGLGLVGLGVGSVFLVRRNGKAEESSTICPSNIGCAAGSQAAVDGLNGDARAAQTISLVGFIGGGVALATGAVLILTASNKSKREAYLVTPLLGPSAAGLLAEGRF